MKRTIIIGHTFQFTIPRVNTVYHGTESASFLTSKIWELIPSDIKGKGSLPGFKKVKTIEKLVIVVSGFVSHLLAIY